MQVLLNFYFLFLYINILGLKRNQNQDMINGSFSQQNLCSSMFEVSFSYLMISYKGFKIMLHAKKLQKIYLFKTAYFVEKFILLTKRKSAIFFLSILQCTLATQVHVGLRSGIKAELFMKIDSDTQTQNHLARSRSPPCLTRRQTKIPRKSARGNLQENSQNAGGKIHKKYSNLRMC